MFTAAELEKKLTELIDAHHVPGAQLTVLDGGELTEVAAGVLSQRTGCPSRPDALFLPGSIGKVYTATLVMMLVDEGKVDLDSPIRRYLPDFEVQDAHARDTVTVRDLLTHTSGFDGDHFTDTGRGDDALAKYVAGCAELPQIVELKRKYGRPHGIHYAAAKNQPKGSVACIEALHAGGVMTSQGIGIQSMSEDTLTAVGRKNIKNSAFVEMFESLRAARISAFCELIWPLPLETLESLKRAFGELLELNATTVVSAVRTVRSRFSAPTGTPLVRARSSFSVIASSWR